MKRALLIIFSIFAITHGMEVENPSGKSISLYKFLGIDKEKIDEIKKLPAELESLIIQYHFPKNAWAHIATADFNTKNITFNPEGTHILLVHNKRYPKKEAVILSLRDITKKETSFDLPNEGDAVFSPNGQEILSVNYSSIILGKNMSTNIQLKAGDIIIVP